MAKGGRSDTSDDPFFLVQILDVFVKKWHCLLILLFEKQEF